MIRMELDKDIRPLSEFRANATSFIERVNKTRRPLVITQHGKSAAVLMDVKEYAMLMERIELLDDIRKAEEDIQEGRVLPHAKALEVVKKRIRR